MKLTHFEFRDYAVDPDTNKVWKAWSVIGSILLVGILLLLCGCQEPVWTSEFTNEQLAQAIYRAEGGAKTRHPYGILTKYKTTTPKQACLNTIAHAKRDWNGRGDFINFLQKRYAPIGVANDPTGLNVNWQKNVRYYLARAR